MMALSKTEVNLRRLLATAPQQQNQAKLIHYVATLREQLEQLAEERTPEGLPRISKAKVNEYSEKIEAVAAKLAASVSDMQLSMETRSGPSASENPSTTEGENIPSSPGLRRRFVPSTKVEDRVRATVEADQPVVKLDATSVAYIDKQRKLQEDMTDEMVELARLLKERTLMMNQSVKNTDKILDSTETAIEHSLASTGRANIRAMHVSSHGFKTACLTWLIMFVMILVFIMVVLLIRIT